MTDDRVCVTHMDSAVFSVLGRPPRCYRRGQHYAACENPDECRGCVPRGAVWGYLCPVCADRLRDGLPRLEDLIGHLRSIESAGDALGERVDTSSANCLVVPETWLAADGLLEALGFPPFRTVDTIDDALTKAGVAVEHWRDNVDDIVNTVDGAARAVMVIRRMQTALKRWPDSEAQYRRIPHLLCPTCKRESLYRRAPIEQFDDLIVECSSDTCDYTRDWFEWIDVYGLVFVELEKAQKAAA